MTDELKYKSLLEKYCDIKSIKIPYQGKKVKKMRKKVRELVDQGVLISGSFQKLNNVCKLLDAEMKSEGNAEFFRAV
jgi:hypothetical protein